MNDFAHVLDAASSSALEAYCGESGARHRRADGDRDWSTRSTTSPSRTSPIRLYREWGIGKKGKDEGILLLLAIKDHKNRVEVGYGLEPIIPTAYAGGVLRGIRPILRQGNYGGALLAAAEQMGQPDRAIERRGAGRPERRLRTSRPQPRGRRFRFR